MGVAVYVEYTPKRSFAVAVDWPGWTRGGRTEEEALAALAAYRGRFSNVCELARMDEPAATEFDVVERVPGNATTVYGAPGVIPELDRAPLAADALSIRLRLLQAAWAVFDEVVARAPESLRKGPRGGGRDRDQVVSHVIEAERAYAAKVGVRQGKFDPLDVAIWTEFRAAEVTGLAAAAESAWPPGYAIRRIAWHVLDHAWEIEDRAR